MCSLRGGSHCTTCTGMAQCAELVGTGLHHAAKVALGQGLPAVVWSTWQAARPDDCRAPLFSGCWSFSLRPP